jgi:hypothetical protein
VLITRPVERLTHADEAWWQTARSQGIAGIGLTDVQLNPVTNLPVVGITLPIIDPNSKQVLGVVRGLVKLTELQHRMSQKAVSAEADIRVFISDGRLIADTASAHDAALILTGAGNMLRQDNAPALRALETKPGADGAGSMLIENKQSRRLAEQVQQLRIEIDEAKRQREISEIVDSDFFQDLQKKAGKLRRRGSPSDE